MICNTINELFADLSVNADTTLAAFPMFKKPAPENAFADRIKKVAEAKPILPSPANDRPAVSYSSKRQPRAERHPMFRNAALVFGSQRVTVAITNMSDTGARVEFPSQPDLPSQVTLVAIGFKREAAVIWKKPGSAGLRFLS